MANQTWDPLSYGKDGAFVHVLASGVLEWLAAKPNERILDLGCGDGQTAKRIVANGVTVMGVDISPEMVSAARSRGIVAMEASVESLPFSDHAFDAVFSNAALHWVKDQDAMMAEVHRVLKPGGRFVAEMGGHGNIAAIRVALKSVLARNGYSDLEDDVNYYPTPDGYARFLIPEWRAGSAPSVVAFSILFRSRFATLLWSKLPPCLRPHCVTRMETGLPTTFACALSPPPETWRGSL
jgi:SAM-dependent methyltransferase